MMPPPVVAVDIASSLLTSMEVGGDAEASIVSAVGSASTSPPVEGGSTETEGTPEGSER